VPVIIDVNTDGGFDPLGSASCAGMRQFFPADYSNEIILHFQVSTCAPPANECIITMMAMSTIMATCFARIQQLVQV